MCGIIGYNGKKNAKKILIEGLKKLEYRGYDSAGIAVSDGINKEIIKSVGRVSILEKKVLNESKIDGNYGIAHTRWATNGAVTINNTHPHTNGRVTLVHNGIIENSDEIKRELINKRVNFYGDTDSEVIAALINYHYEDNPKDAIFKAVKKLKGSYALVIMFDKDDKLYAIRKDSPLIIGYNDSSSFASSDISAISNSAKKICYLDTNILAVMDKENVSYYDEKGKVLEEEKNIEKYNFDTSKDGYPHYMLKEIMEEGKLVSNFLDKYLYSDRKEFNISSYKYVDIVACGSAMHAGLIGKSLIERYNKIKVSVYMASEYRYQDNIYNDKENTLIILISQSGETADTIATLRYAKEKGIKTLGIVNREGSTIAREADSTIMCDAGIEIAVATTKAYIMQVLVLSLIAIKSSNYKEYLDNFKKLPMLINTVLNNKDKIEKTAKEIYKIDSCFFIGRLIDYYIAMEGSLKLKEVSYIHSECYPAGELKHGTISLIEDGTLVFGVITDKNIMDKTISNLKEVEARGAKVFIITTDDVKIDSDLKITVPSAEYYLQSIPVVTALELLAYYVALYRKCDIDKPRNLAKSVTVE